MNDTQGVLTKTTQNTKERNIYIDAIKGFAIILMLFGHSIQCGSGSEFLSSQNFYNDIIFKAIYGFHMPLFMIMSGYVFFYSTKKTALKIVSDKITRLVVPIIAWSLLISIYKTSINKDVLFWDYFNTALTNYWFLWSVFISSIVVLIVSKLLKDNIYVYILLFALMFVSSDAYCMYIYKYLVPYFVLGYLFNKHKHIFLKDLNKKRLLYILVAFITVYSIMVSFWKVDFYIYFGKFNLLWGEPLYQFFINIYRYIAGVLGSISVIIIFSFIPKNWFIKMWSYLGKRTLEIFIISGFLYESLQHITKDYTLNYATSIIQTVIIAIASLLIGFLIKNTKTILLGER